MNPSSPLPSDDPELTRYALGEGEDTTVSEPSIAARYWTNPATREHIDQVRELSQELIFFFSTESPPNLTAEQRANIIDHALSASPTDEHEQRLVDYLVGEVTPSDPRQWEAKIAYSRAIGCYLDEVRAEIQAIQQTLKAETPLRLTPAQRAHIFAEGARRRSLAQVKTTTGQLTKPQKKQPTTIYQRAAWMAAAAAALVIIYQAWQTTGKPPFAVTERDSSSGRQVVIHSPQPIPAEKKSVTLSVPTQPTAIPYISGLPSQVTLPLLTQTDTQHKTTSPPPTHTARPSPTDGLVLPPASSPQIDTSATLFHPAHLSPVIQLVGAVPSHSFSLLRRWFDHAQTYPSLEKWRSEELISHAASLAPETISTPTTENVHGHLEAAICPWNKEHVLVRATLSTPSVEFKKLPPRRLTLLVRWEPTHPTNERARLILWSGLRALEDTWRPEDQLSLIFWGEKNGALMHQGMIKTPSQALAALNQPDLPISLSRQDALSLAVQTAISQGSTATSNHFIIVTNGPLDFSENADDSLNSVLVARERCRVHDIHPQIYQCGWSAEAATSASLLTTTVLDSVSEAQAHFTQQLNQPAHAVITDLTASVEFSPAEVSAVRLLGFHPSHPSPTTAQHQPWKAGQKATLLYEVIPATVLSPVFANQRSEQTPEQVTTPKMRQVTDPLHITLRWKYQKAEAKSASIIHEQTATWNASPVYWPATSEAYRLSAAAAGLSLMMQPTTVDFPADTLSHMVQSTLDHDADGRRAEFHRVLEKASALRQLSTR